MPMFCLNGDFLPQGLNLGGEILPAMDSLIAATVLTHKFALVTRNVEDFNSANAGRVSCKRCQRSHFDRCVSLMGRMIRASAGGMLFLWTNRYVP